MSVKNLRYLLALFISVSACGPIRDMKEMKQTTQEMSQTTQGMAQTTQDMSQTTQDMSKTTKGMAATTNSMAQNIINTYEDMRQGATLEARRPNFLSAMADSDDFEFTGFQAVLYFCSFEFQLAKSTDGPEALDKMYKAAVGELRGAMARLLPNDRSSIDLPPSGRSQLSLYALAAAMHRLNPRQELRAKNEHLKTVSMLDLILAGLNYKKISEAGQDVPEFAREVLKGEQELVYLLKVRANILAAMPMKRLSDVSDSQIGRLWDGWMRSNFNWTANNAEMNREQLDYAAYQLTLALETRDFLSAHGYKPLMNERLIAIYENMIFTDDVVDQSETKVKALNNLRILRRKLVRGDAL